MAAMGQVHAQNGITGLEEGKIDGHIGLGAGMGLDIGVGRPEELLDPAQGQVFRGIHIFAAAVKAPARIPLGVLMGQNGTLGLEHRAADEVFRGDHLQLVQLALTLTLDDSKNFRVSAGQVFHPVKTPAGQASWANRSSRSKRSWWRPPSNGVPSQTRTISFPRSGPMTRPPITSRLASLWRRLMMALNIS